MAILDARLAGLALDMSDGTLVNYDSVHSFSATSYAWNTSTNSSSDSANRVYADVTGIGVGPNFYPFAGSVTALKLDIAQDGDPSTNQAIDALITLSAPVALTDLVSPSGTDPTVAADKFWETLLSGNDLIYAPNHGKGLVFGDFLQILSSASTIEEKTGGDDIISSAATAGDNILVSIGGNRTATQALIGDAYRLEGFVDINNIAYFASLHGGDDRITQTGRAAYNLIGDAYLVGDVASVVGGDDIIRSEASVSNYGLAPTRLLIGDVAENGGIVVGGNDTITGTNDAFINEVLSGDVWRQSAATTGGDDLVKGRAGHDFIAGDVVSMGGTLTGGADNLLGGEDSDIIAGDALQLGNDGPFGSLGMVGAVRAQLTGGADVIRGEAGNDMLAGDAFAFGSLTADSTVSGGDDFIDGGDGDDQIFGDFGVAEGVLPPGFFDNGGDDRLYGGNGNDEIQGNAGNDLLDGGAGADTMTGGTGNDTYIVDDAGDHVAEANGGGTDLMKSSVSFSFGGQYIEKLTLTGSTDINCTGNSLANTIRGNAGNNILDGRRGSDTIRGYGGADSFVFQDTLGASNIDNIVDFNVAADTIRLENAIFNAIVGTGTLTAAQFRANTSGLAADSSDRIIYETDTGKLFYDSNGNSAGGATQFGLLSSGLALTNADFFVT